MQIPLALLTAFPHSRQLLLDVARRQVDDGMLREIAEADYESDVDKHLVALRRIRDEGAVPEHVGWCPGEVLDLTSFTSPGHIYDEPDSDSRRGHRIRLFACAALLQGEGHMPGREETLARCLVSAVVLGDETCEAAARYVTWALPSAARQERWLFAFGLLVLATRLRFGRLTDGDVGAAAAWVEAEKAELVAEFAGLRWLDRPRSPRGLATNRPGGFREPRVLPA